jgi:hypothetical protein
MVLHVQGQPPVVLMRTLLVFAFVRSASGTSCCFPYQAGALSPTADAGPVRRRWGRQVRARLGHGAHVAPAGERPTDAVTVCVVQGPHGLGLSEQGAKGPSPYPVPMPMMMGPGGAMPYGFPPSTFMPLPGMSNANAVDEPPTHAHCA